MTIYAYTTYDATVNPVRCCAHIEEYNSSNVLISHNHVYANANTYFQYNALWYYMSYDATQVANKRCCVWTTKSAVDPNGNLVIVKDKILFCGDKIAL